MRTLFIATACLALTACGTLGGDLLGVNEKSTPEAQRIKAEADAKLTAALADRLIYCTITGTLDLTLQVGPASGVKNTAGMNCPAKPWDASPSAFAPQ